MAHRTSETIRRWIWSGRVQSVKQGNKLLVRRADVLDLVDAAAPSAHAISLREWAALLDLAGSSGTSASDLVLEDRDQRAGR